MHLIPIPTPHVLNPDRLLANDRGGFGTADDHKSRADLLDKALQDSCAYAQQLWDNLDAVRHYLMDSLPPDPRPPGPHRSPSAAPTGPDDEQGWENWIAAFASVTSVLCGPHGDSGLGLHEHAERRRNAAPRRFSIRTSSPRAASGRRGERLEPQAHSEPARRRRAGAKRPASAVSSVATVLRSGLPVLLVVPASRGLRPRRYRTL